jgi:hypothetical protein
MSKIKDEFDKKLNLISNKQLIEIAQAELEKLCKTGAKSFNMCIPPQITDTDIIFQELIDRFDELTS